MLFVCRRELAIQLCGSLVFRRPEIKPNSLVNRQKQGGQAAPRFLQFALDMKNNPLTTILLVALAVSAIWSVVLCIQFIRNARELGAMQGEVAAIGSHEGIDQAILNEALAYSTNHPAMVPVLESLGFKKAPATPPATAAPVKPSTR